MTSASTSDIALRRELLELSQLELAALASVSLMTLRRMEYGLRVRPQSYTKVDAALTKLERAQARKGSL